MAPDDVVPERVEINGVEDVDWGAWRNSPVTLAFRKFLTDYADQLEANHLERWRSGSMDLAEENESRGRVAAAREMEGLQFEDLVLFYGPQKQDEDEAEVDQDDPRPVRRKRLGGGE